MACAAFTPLKQCCGIASGNLPPDRPDQPVPGLLYLLLD